MKTRIQVFQNLDAALAHAEGAGTSGRCHCGKGGCPLVPSWLDPLAVAFPHVVYWTREVWGSCAEWPFHLLKCLRQARGMRSYGWTGGRRGLKRTSSGWARPCMHWCSRAVLCSPMSSSHWASGVVASGAREASPYAPSYKLGGFARGFAQPTPSKSTNSLALVFRIFLCLRWRSLLSRVRGRGRPPSAARAPRGSRSDHATTLGAPRRKTTRGARGGGRARGHSRLGGRGRGRRSATPAPPPSSRLAPVADHVGSYPMEFLVQLRGLVRSRLRLPGVFAEATVGEGSPTL